MLKLIVMCVTILTDTLLPVLGYNRQHHQETTIFAIICTPNWVFESGGCSVNPTEPCANLIHSLLAPS
ncbi:hypothetical protein BC941DRAFT_239344 [Chlamydoabsidia padenii]|nr:hypothetical protein BC941DRAFT_239344 [Chlamydoabsidia padenii]